MSDQRVIWADVPDSIRARIGDECACETVDDGWRPCPYQLCERSDHDHIERFRELTEILVLLEVTCQDLEAMRKGDEAYQLNLRLALEKVRGAQKRLKRARAVLTQGLNG